MVEETDKQKFRAFYRYNLTFSITGALSGIEAWRSQTKVRVWFLCHRGLRKRVVSLRKANLNCKLTGFHYQNQGFAVAQAFLSS